MLTAEGYVSLLVVVAGSLAIAFALFGDDPTTFLGLSAIVVAAATGSVVLVAFVG